MDKDGKKYNTTDYLDRQAQLTAAGDKYYVPDPPLLAQFFGKYATPGPSFMIWSIWFLWYAVTIVNVIVLLNFLIAYIGDTYTEVYDRNEIDDYVNMANMNHEWREIRMKLKDIKEWLRHWVPIAFKYFLKIFLIPLLPFSQYIRKLFFCWVENNY
jgi:hypothetical protein